MNRFYSVLLFLISSILLSNCIEQIDVFTSSDPTLIIDGIVTNEPGPHIVRLSYSTNFNVPLEFEKVDQATVKIIDNLGNEENLIYDGNGVYKSSTSFRGEIGRYYHIYVQLESGDSYESIPEPLLEVPEIESLTYHQEGENVVYSVEFTDPEEQQNFYRWRFTGVYEVLAPKAYELYQNPGPLPSPYCFSNGVRPEVNKVWKCWVTDYDAQYLKIEEDRFFNGRQVKDFVINEMELSRKYDRGYEFIVKQYSLTKPAYEYWKALENQIGNTGTIFETANYQIKGNIKSVSNPNQLVLGYFGASAISVARTLVFDFQDRFGNIPCTINNSGCFPERCFNCLKFGAGSTNLKPATWP